MAQGFPVRFGARRCGVGLARGKDVARDTVLHGLVAGHLLEAVVEIGTLALRHCLNLLGGTAELLRGAHPRV